MRSIPWRIGEFIHFDRKFGRKTKLPSNASNSVEADVLTTATELGILSDTVICSKIVEVTRLLDTFKALRRNTKPELGGLVIRSSVFASLRSRRKTSRTTTTPMIKSGEDGFADWALPKAHASFSSAGETPF